MSLVPFKDRDERLLYIDQNGSGLVMYKDKLLGSFGPLKVLVPGVLSDAARLADASLLAIEGAQITSSTTGKLWQVIGGVWGDGVTPIMSDHPLVSGGKKLIGCRQWVHAGSVAGGGTAGTTWHQTTSAQRRFNAVQLAYMNPSSSAAAVYDNIAVCSPASFALGVPNPEVGNSAWVIAPSLTVPFDAGAGGAGSPYVNRLWTPKISLPSANRSDGAKGPLLSIRTHTVSTLPGYANFNDSALWTPAHQLDGVRYSNSQAGNFTTTSQSGFAPGAAHDISPVTAVRFFYDNPGKTVMVLGDSIEAGAQAESGIAKYQSFIQRAIVDLQDAGYPVDLVAGAIGGQDFDEAWNPTIGGDRSLIDFFQPDIIVIPTFTPNQSPVTSDANWSKAVRLIEYAASRYWSPQIVLLQGFPQGGANNVYPTLRDLVANAGFPVIDPAPYVSTLSTGGNAWTWIGGIGGAYTADGTHPNAVANIAMKAHVADVLRQLL